MELFLKNHLVFSSGKLVLSSFLDVTHQADEKEENLEPTASGSDADNVPVSYRWHRHHQEVDAVPVGKWLGTRRLEVGGVALVLQLEEERKLWRWKVVQESHPGLCRFGQSWCWGIRTKNFGLGCWGTEARYHATRKRFGACSNLHLASCTSSGVLCQWKPSCFQGILIHIKWGMLWVTIQQKSASLYNFSN